MAYKPFKMKGHTLPGINQRSEGNTDLPDGRSASSAFQYKESPAKKSKQGEYLTNVKTGEIRENFPDSFSIIKEGTKTVHRTKENKDDWQPSDKTGKLHPKLEKLIDTDFDFNTLADTPSIQDSNLESKYIPTVIKDDIIQDDTGREFTTLENELEIIKGEEEAELEFDKQVDEIKSTAKNDFENYKSKNQDKLSPFYIEGGKTKSVLDYDDT